MQSWALRPLQGQQPLVRQMFIVTLQVKAQLQCNIVHHDAEESAGRLKCLMDFCPTLQHLDTEQHADSKAGLERGQVAGEAAPSVKEPASELLGHRGNTVCHKCSCIQSRTAQGWQQLTQQAAPVPLRHNVTLGASVLIHPVHPPPRGRRSK